MLYDFEKDLNIRVDLIEDEFVRANYPIEIEEVSFKIQR